MTSVAALDDPQDMFVPLLLGLPIGDYRIALPVLYLRLVSQRFHELGAFMKCPQCGHVKEPSRKWVAPSTSTPHWLSDPGRWEKTERRPKSNKFDSVIPTREQCDLSNPQEMFAWMFVGLPGMNGAPMLFDGGWAMEASEHLFDGGAMLSCPECGFEKTPEKEYVPPNLSGPHWLTSPGEWVPQGVKPQPTLAEEIDAALSRMNLRQQAELKKALEAALAGRELPDTPAGTVVAGMPDHLKQAVLKQLQENQSG